jgi:hypothetical protein
MDQRSCSAGEGARRVAGALRAVDRFKSGFSRGPTALFALVTLLLLVCCILFPGVASTRLSAASASNAGTAPEADSEGSAKLAAACTQTVERFIQQLDVVMTESPRSIKRYNAVLANHYFYRQGFPGMPATVPHSSIIGCDVKQVIQVAQRSKFLYEVRRPPLYEGYGLEFRNDLAKVYFSIDRNSGDIVGVGAAWIKFYP